MTDSCIVLSLAKLNSGVVWKSLQKTDLARDEQPLKDTGTMNNMNEVENNMDKAHGTLNDLDWVPVKGNSVSANNTNSVYISNEFNPFTLASNHSSSIRSVLSGNVSKTNEKSPGAEGKGQSTNKPVWSSGATNGPQTDEKHTEEKVKSSDKVRSSDTPSKAPVKKPSVPLRFHRLSPNPFTSPSFTGIANLGNTCFMSSVLQCLSNTVEVRDYFLGGFYKEDINLVNPLGHKGVLAESFCSCVSKLWQSGVGYITPMRFKVVLYNRPLSRAAKFAIVVSSLFCEYRPLSFSIGSAELNRPMKNHEMIEKCYVFLAKTTL